MLSLTYGKYQVIKTPIGTEQSEHPRPYLGRSEKGVYFATIHDYLQFRVWILDESSNQVEWVLKHHIDLHPYVSWPDLYSDYNVRIDGPWILENDNKNKDNDKMLPKDNSEWDSDEDNILEEDGYDDDEVHYSVIDFLGFHPYKEIIFLMSSFLGIAFHLNTLKVQYLGKLRPKGYNTHTAGVYESFPFTPCMIGELPETSQETHPEDPQYM